MPPLVAERRSDERILKGWRSRMVPAATESVAERRSDERILKGSED